MLDLTMQRMRLARVENQKFGNPNLVLWNQQPVEGALPCDFRLPEFVAVPKTALEFGFVDSGAFIAVGRSI